MKICIVSPFPPPYGGMAIQAEKLARLLALGGKEVIMVRTNPLASGKGDFVSGIPGLRTAVNLLLFLYNLQKALRQSDIIYFLTGFFNFFFWVTYPALLLIKLSRKPVIMSARGGNARQFFEMHGKLVKPILKRLNAITTPSGFLRDVFRETLGMDAVIVPNIADLAQFVFHKRQTFRPRLLYTRNLEPIYDPACALRAFHMIWEQFPEAVLSVAGDGSLRRDAEKLAHDLGLAHAVTFHGQVNHEQIQQLYAEHDIFLNTSRVDNMPGSILEAFACGLPIVSTNAGGIPCMVENGVTGLLSNIGDHVALSHSVIQILEQPDLGRKLALAGKKEANNYTWGAIRPIMEALFSKILI